MKQLVSIVLLTSFLLGGSLMTELMKMPILVQHYLEHKAENNKLSVEGFLKMHYASKQALNESHNKGGKLPFKTCTCHIAILMIHSQVPIFFNFIRPTYFTQKSIATPSNCMAYNSSYLNHIWQPPKYFL